MDKFQGVANIGIAIVGLLACAVCLPLSLAGMVLNEMVLAE